MAPPQVRFLVSLQTRNCCVVHAYLICKRVEQRVMLNAATNAVFNMAEKAGLQHLNIVLSTGPLTSFPEVESILRKRSD